MPLRARHWAAAGQSSGLDRVEVHLLRSAYEGDIERVHEALEQGSRITAFDPETGLTALHLAVGTNNLPLTRYLVEVRDSPFGPDYEGRWPTIVAAECEASEELNDYIVEMESAYLKRLSEEE